MINAREWVKTLAERARAAFGERLLFMGLQGSHRRGEATEQSDLDVVTVLDTVGLDDLRRYRELVRAMPEGALACGFLGGLAELRAWPKHELFALARDTEDCHGRLADLLPPIARADVREGVRVAAGGLYHMVVHSYLYGDAATRAATLAGAGKAVFFLLLAVEYLRSGEYAPSRAALVERLPDRERELLETIHRPDNAATPDAVDRNYALLLAWSADVLRNA